MTGSEPASGPPPGGQRYVIIHGHFYQPPRENPWLDIIEEQESAAPYHDWNERIYDQCYRPNATSRILDPRGMIIDIHNNYLYLSFNFGPTLFRWLEKNHPKIAQNIIAADRESALKFKKHGNALAQVYNHMIMPLASRRDQLTQIRWAKSYFRRRFKREPEGIWLAETAINMETVTCLIEEGIRFVVLSPTQAESFRSLDGSDPSAWKTVDNGSIDTRRAYRIFPRDRDGARIRDGARGSGYLDVFFFNEGLSREVSFGDLLINASTLGAKIRSCYDDSPSVLHDQAVIIATDGETFGHHKPFGDMCLAYFFSTVAKEMGIIPVNFAYYLEKNPPLHEVVLKNEFGEGTAWSCQHGVGRWSRDCGCKSGGPLTWNQAWRAPLRQAFDMLQKHIDESFVNQVSQVVAASDADASASAWKLRDRYMELCDAPTIAEFRALLAKEQLASGMTDETAMIVRRLCEAQKYMLFSYTSCGWFFSDISGIETVQNIAYAGRAISLALDDERREAVIAEFLRLLSGAKSNNAPQDGSTLFSAHVSPFLRSLSILCFTAIVEKTVAPDKSEQKDFEYFGYRISLTHGEDKAGSDGAMYTQYDASVKNEKSGEAMDMAVLVSREGGQLRAWCLRRQDASGEPGSGMASGEGIREHQKALALDLSCVFEESKVRLSHYFLDAMSKDTENKYAVWMEHHVKSLDSLAALGISLPPFVAAPIAYVLTRQWNTAINEIEIYGREEAIYERLLSLWGLSKKYGITLDYTKSAQLILDLLTAELKIFSETLSIVSSERMRFLLNLVDRFSIPFAKNKVEDLFHAILRTAIRPMYDEFKTTTENNQKEHVVRLLQFARRMNFNTDDFPVS